MGGEPAGCGLEALEHALGYGFRNPDLALLALTHSSREGANQQRLEFLGDAVLGAAVAASLYARHPDWDEGAMSVARTRRVCRDSLALCARRLGIPALLRVSREVVRTGAVHERDSVLADTLEALLGAVFLDGGFAAAQAVADGLFGGSDDALPVDARPDKDSKTRLQEWLQARGWPLPDYALLERTGPANAPVFRATCRAGRPLLVTEAEGRSRKAAEQAAAARMLTLLVPVADAGADGDRSAHPPLPESLP